MSFTTDINYAIKATNDRLKKFSHIMEKEKEKRGYLDGRINDCELLLLEINDRILFLETLKKKGIVSFDLSEDYINNEIELEKEKAACCLTSNGTEEEVTYTLLNIQNKLREILSLIDNEIPQATIDYLKNIDNKVANLNKNRS